MVPRQAPALGGEGDLGRELLYMTNTSQSSIIKKPVEIVCSLEVAFYYISSSFDVGMSFKDPEFM